MNAEQIIQSTDLSLGPVRLHPSCYVFTVARSQNLIPSHRAHSCEPSQSNLFLEVQQVAAVCGRNKKGFSVVGINAKICIL